MTILLTGASGFTGKYFSSAATDAGHAVWPLAADLSDSAALLAEVRKVKPAYVVHLAAISFVGHADARAFYDVNLFGTLNLLSALASLESPPAMTLLASSANVYGNCAISPIAETQTPSPINHYGVSKLAMEYMAKNYVDRLPLVMSRAFNYTGPGQSNSFVIPKLVDHFRAKANKLQLGNLTVEREFNDVRSVCDIYLKLLSKGVAGEIYNVCSGNPFTLQYVLDELTQQTGHSPSVELDPAFVRKNEVQRLCGDPAKLHAAIGPVTYPSISDTLAWMLGEPATAE